MLTRRLGLEPARMEGLYTVQREREVDLLDLIVNANLSDEMSIAQALAEEAGVACLADVDASRVPTALGTRVPIGFARGHKVLPFAEDDNNVHVAIADPFDVAALDDLRLLFGKNIEPSVAGAEKIVDAKIGRAHV